MATTPYDQIIHGETYDVTLTGQDDAGDAFPIPDTWTAAMRICCDRVGGDALEDVPLTVAAGVATGSFDTGDAPYAPGTYFFDFRLTDAAGADYWSRPVRLVILPRCTPAS